MNAAWLDSMQAPAQWRAIVLTRGPRVATWVLALALGVQAALLITDLAAGGRVPTPVNPSRTANGTPRPTLDVAGIAGSHLFGTPAVERSAQDAAHAPQSSMPLVLSGVIAAERPQAGLAILGPTAQTGKVYAVGDALPGGARLHSVLGDRVVVDRGGQLESLILPRQLAGGPAPPSAAALPTQSPVGDRMRRLMSDQPQLLTDVIRPQVSLKDGKVQGFRVYPAHQRMAFMRLGLRPGDLVTAINGTPLDDPSRGEEILRTLSSTPEARVTVIRNEQQQDLVLNVAQVMQDAESLSNGGSQGPGGQGMNPGANPVGPAIGPALGGQLLPGTTLNGRAERSH